MADILKHLDLNSADGTQLNLDALYQIAPSAFIRITPSFIFAIESLLII